MKRQTTREIAMLSVFSKEFSTNSFVENFADLKEEDEIFAKQPKADEIEYITEIINGVTEHKTQIDEVIEKYSQGWKIERISRVAVAILRVCIYEILYMPNVPNSAAINSAVEISKKYEDEKTTSFINGILGSFMRSEIEGNL